MDWTISVVFMPRAYAGSHCSDRNQQAATARAGLLVVDRSVVTGKGRSGDKVKRWARPPESAAFGAVRRSLRTASAGRAAGRGASTATPPGGRARSSYPSSVQTSAAVSPLSRAGGRRRLVFRRLAAGRLGG